MSTICALGETDVLRLCGAAAEVLDANGYFSLNTNSVNEITMHSGCVITTEEGLGSFVSFPVRPCKINSTHPTFYVNRNISEENSIFVYLPVINESHLKVRLFMRINEVTALMYPMRLWYNRNARLKLILCNGGQYYYYFYSFDEINYTIMRYIVVWFI